MPAAAHDTGAAPGGGGAAAAAPPSPSASRAASGTVEQLRDLHLRPAGPAGHPIDGLERAGSGSSGGGARGWLAGLGRALRPGSPPPPAALAAAPPPRARADLPILGDLTFVEIDARSLARAASGEPGGESRFASAPPSLLASPEVGAVLGPPPPGGSPPERHRRARSLLNPLGLRLGGGHARARSAASAGSGDEAADAAAAARALAPAPGAPLPAGARGLRNVGNSCFISAAVQCLRHAPGVALALAPDLLALAAAAEAEEEAARANAEEAGKAEAAAEAAPEEPEPAPVAEPAAELEPAAEPAAEPVVAVAAPAEAAPETAGAAATPAPPPAPPPRPARGELAAATAALMRALFAAPVAAPPADPAPLVRALRGFPAAAELLDGRQHDCMEAFHTLVDLLHEDLKVEALPPRAEAPAGAAEVAVADGAAPADGAAAAAAEARKADAAWAALRAREASPLAAAFVGQLQSAVACSRCGARSATYEACWDVSLPLAAAPPPPGAGGVSAWLGLRPPGPAADLADCLRAFTAEETLAGAEAFQCGACGARAPAAKRLRLHRAPPALALHVKRFRHRGGGAAPDKLAAPVAFPLEGLDLAPFVSPECPHAPAELVYDLYAVAYHSGSAAGGHYTAAARGADGRWRHFNDGGVREVPAAEIGGDVRARAAAYMLFYARREFADPAAAGAALAAAAAAAEAARPRDARGASGGGAAFFHRRNASR
jgi:ubiquitin C-terminal hydrolase